MEKQRMPKHFWRIHARVARRVLRDLSTREHAVIAQDATHESPEFKWFEVKVWDDAMRLFTDPTYYDNQEFSFRVPKHEPV